MLLLMDELRRAGHTSCLLARSGGALAKRAAAAGFEVGPAHLAAVWRYSQKAEAVHTHDARAHTLAALAAQKSFVASRRVAFPVSRSIVSRWKYGRAARYLAISEFVAQQLLAAGVPRAKIDVVYDGVERDAVEHDSPAGEWNREGPVVALGSRDPQKGRDVLEAVEASSEIQFVFSENLQRDLRGASVFVYISRSEGLGSAALLAMSLGVPVIASKVGGLREVIEDGVSGLLIENQAAAIAAAIRRIRGYAELARRLSAGGRAGIGERFTAAHLLRGTLGCYERASDERAFAG